MKQNLLKKTLFSYIYDNNLKKKKLCAIAQVIKSPKKCGGGF